MNLTSILKWTALAVTLGVLYATGATDKLLDLALHRSSHKQQAVQVAPPAVTVAHVTAQEFVETVLVTGSLVAREEILIAPEVDGLRVVEIKVEQGDLVKKGDLLAVLETETLEAQLAQNAASLARSTASIAQAKNGITESDARLSEAKSQLDRAKPLTKQGYLSESVFDQRQAAVRTITAQLAAARNALAAAEAEKSQIEAQRRELEWRRSRSEIRAPTDGLISRRNARIGSIAMGGAALGGGEPMFRLIQNSEIELDGEVPEADLRKLKAGQTAKITVAGGLDVEGQVRLVSPEVDSNTRLGRVRLFIGSDPRLRVGSFASAGIETARARGLSLPVSAVSTSSGNSSAQRLIDDKVETVTVETGLASGGNVQILSGLAEGDTVVARAGTFLRDGDTVRPVETGAKKVSDAR